MPQQKASSPEVIYQTLINDAEFSSLIGEYVFVTNNTAIDSILIKTPGQDLPNLQSQTGLEVIIHDIGDITYRSFLTDAINTVATWKVFLVAWPPANGETVTHAASRMLQIFGGAYSMETVAVSDGLQAMVQTMVLISEDCPILV
jgi:hypothetical protein